MKSIKINIFGKQYPLKINEGDEEMMYKIASFVDARFQEFRKALINQPDTTIMILASLSIAEELFLETEGKKSSEPQADDTRRIFSEMNASIRQILDDIEENNPDIESE